MSASALAEAIGLYVASLPEEREEETALLAQARRGDPSAFEELVRRYQTRVYNLAYRMLRQREAAEDVTQEAFLKAFASLPKLREAAAFRAWLFRIAVSLCIAQLRSPKHREIITDILPEQTAPPMPEEAEFTHLVHTALAQLPPHYRLALVACYLEGRSYEEGAQLAGVGVRTFKTRVHRARQQLRVLLSAALETHEL